MDRLDAMEAFVAAVDAGSLSRAARNTNVPLATISRRVADLEEYLGVQLLVRGARRLALTEAGVSYLNSSRRILEDIVEAERAATGEYASPRGELVISATHVLGRTHVLPLVCEFLREFPEIRIKLLQADYSVDLTRQQVDIGVRVGEPRDQNLVAVPAGFATQHLYASRSYLDRRGRPQAPADLAQHQCVMLEMHEPGRPWDFRNPWLEYAGPLHGQITVSTADACLAAIDHGMGIGYLFSYQISAAVDQLEVVLEAFSPPRHPINLVYVPRRPLPLKMRTFLDFVAPRLRERLS